MKREKKHARSYNDVAILAISFALLSYACVLFGGRTGLSGHLYVFLVEKKGRNKHAHMRDISTQSMRAKNRLHSVEERKKQQHQKTETKNEK